ncbi:hypothetical protein PCYB_005050, partial [Plasmodium cynomolgi strain B]
PTRLPVGLSLDDSVEDDLYEQEEVKLDSRWLSKNVFMRTKQRIALFKGDIKTADKIWPCDKRITVKKVPISLFIHSIYFINNCLKHVVIYLGQWNIMHEDILFTLQYSYLKYLVLLNSMGSRWNKSNDGEGGQKYIRMKQQLFSMMEKIIPPCFTNLGEINDEEESKPPCRWQKPAYNTKKELSEYSKYLNFQNKEERTKKTDNENPYCLDKSRSYRSTCKNTTCFIFNTIFYSMIHYIKYDSKKVIKQIDDSWFYSKTKFLKIMIYTLTCYINSLCLKKWDFFEFIAEYHLPHLHILPNWKKISFGVQVRNVKPCLMYLAEIIEYFFNYIFYCLPMMRVLDMNQDELASMTRILSMFLIPLHFYIYLDNLFIFFGNSSKHVKKPPMNISSLVDMDNYIAEKNCDSRRNINDGDALQRVDPKKRNKLIFYYEVMFKCYLEKMLITDSRTVSIDNLVIRLDIMSRVLIVFALNNLPCYKVIADLNKIWTRLNSQIDQVSVKHHHMILSSCQNLIDHRELLKKYRMTKFRRCSTLHSYITQLY